MSEYTLILLRHGNSVWNQENLFTGWHDVDLSPQGRLEAAAAGRELVREQLAVDVAFTSMLKRAIRTLWIMLDEMDRMWVPIETNWRLNERHYGALQGLDKAATTAQHGEEQTKIWRRSYDVPPPPVDVSSPEHPASDPRYRLVNPADLPATECLKDVVERVVPHFHATVVPQLRAGMNVLVAAHGNSLRALVMALEDISSENIAELNIPTGVPRLYKLSDSLAVNEVTYLGDAEKIKAATDAVANQAKPK